MQNNVKNPTRVKQLESSFCSEILDKNYTEESIHKRLQNCKDYKSLENFIKEDIFIITNNEFPFGSLGSEHLLKCFEMANYFSSIKFIPNVLGLREKFTKVTNNKTFYDKIDPIDGKIFYRKRFKHLKLNDKELTEISSKFNLKEFSTFDILAENTIMLFNSLPGIKTIQSCTGHSYALRLFCHSDLRLEADKRIVNLEKLKRKFRNLYYDYDKNIFKISITSNNNRIYIDFFHIPSEDWIRANDKTPVMELCEKNLNMLVSTFGYKPKYNCTNKRFRNSDVQTVDKVRRMIYKFINNLKDNLDLSDENDEKFLEIFQPRCLIFEREYREYYNSEISIDIIKKFWKRLEYLGNRLRFKTNIGLDG
ncbi:MAG: hypothetical protein KAW92_12960 [Candidatus Cloacimonetes bacterium]|nr:hypothetical protein [Candidatus Cloacimonadota bacterium]